ncbi:MAG: hypothetical protein ABI678_11785 [Kofleriaceae bacterium]
MRGATIVMLLGLVTPAAADELGFAWTAPEACPSISSVEARVEQRLGHSLDPALPIHIGVWSSSGHFTAKLQLGTDVRTLTSDRCDELADAIAIIVSRISEERALLHRLAPPRVAVVEPPRAPTIVVHRDLSTQAESHEWSIGVRLSGVSGIGIVPEVGLGAEVALTARHATLMGEVSATKWLASGADRSTSHVDVGLGVTSARIGWRPEDLPLRAWIGGEVGSMDSTGLNYTSSDNSGRWFAAGAGFGVGWPMTRWLRVVGSTEVLLALERVKFSEPSGAVFYAPSPMSARCSFGIEVGWE